MPPTSTLRPGKNSSIVRASGGQIACARPTRNTNSPTVTTRLTLIGASRSPRARNRSMSSPPSGATTPTTRISATQGGRPASTDICQNTNDMTMPNAPWARLNTRVVA
jgi:hypothetical protein